MKFTDNSKKVLSKFDKAVGKGLEAIGQAAVTNAKEVLTKTVYTGDKPYPLTGRLRNSVTFAISGKPAHEQSYTADVKGTTETYSYNGTVGDKKENAVYIGTNVEYAAGIEYGTHRKAGAVHFLQKAATEHSHEYKSLAKQAMENSD